MLTRHIIRIKTGPLRAAIWTAWFIVPLIDFLALALVHEALLRRSTWQSALVIYLVGIDGLP